jgi:hypothetical protein
VSLRIEWTEDNGTQETLDVDVSPREGHERTAELTDHAVERGSDISDHVKVNNGTLTFEGVISNHPLQTPRTHMNGVTGEVRPVRLESGRTANVLKFSARFDRVRAVDEVLEGLISARRLVRIVTHLRTYEEMVITRFRVDLEAKDGNALPFSIDAKKPRIVQTTTAQVPRPAERRARRSAQRGNQPPAPTPTPQSLLARLFFGRLPAGGM